MREKIQTQPMLGSTNIADIKIDNKSRDDIPNILKGLQYIYINPQIRDKILLVIESVMTEAQMRIGRSGLNLWAIFVLAILRVNLNWDYDRLQHMANEHLTIRQMLGEGGPFDTGYNYPLQTIKDNVHLLTPEVLDKINIIVVKAGHELFKKKENQILKGRADSFVVEKNVAFPTDIKLLQTAMAKAIKLTARVALDMNRSDFRQHYYNIKQLKKQFLKIQKIKKGKGKDKENRVIEAHQNYIDQANYFIDKLESSYKEISKHQLSDQIRQFVDDAIKQIDLIDRRVIKGETIPASDKIHSLFERDTEWVNKGKANNKIELGHRVAIIEDQYQFIIHHRVMINEVDSDVTVQLIKDCQTNFPELKSCSFDKGFSSSDNQKDLEKILDDIIMPKKGKLSVARQKVELSNDFIKERNQHSAIESAINCLENHGLDKCHDRGTDNFKLYVSISVAARNMQRIGSILRSKEQDSEKRKKRKMLKAA